MNHRLHYIFLICCLAVPIASQQTDESLDAVIIRATERSTKYLETFRNLVANEKRTFETFRDNGTLRRRRTVESNFIVYQLATNEKQMVEFRHVTAIDGRPQRNADRRAQQFFARLVKAGTSTEELGRIRKESFRHDEIRVEGYTLFQGVPLIDNLRDVIEFSHIRNEILDGNDVIVLSYQQIKQSRYVRLSKSGDKEDDSALVDIDIDAPPNTLLRPLLRGTLWLDNETLDIRRELREMTAQPDGFSDPVVVMRTEFLYDDSDFGILTPKFIKLELFKVNLKKRTALMDVRTTMEYTRFTNPDVEIRSAEVNGRDQ